MIINCFHGTTEKFAEQIIRERKFLFSPGQYDWLGPGVYFFQDAPLKAWYWAIRKAHIHDERPAVIAASFKLRDCLDLVEISSWQLFTLAQKKHVDSERESGRPIVHQKDPVLRDFEGKRRRIFSGDVVADEPHDDFRNFANSRGVDSAVIQYVIELTDDIREESNSSMLCSVRCLFNEGRQLYRGSGFFDHNNIQFVYFGVRKPNSNDYDMNFDCDYVKGSPSIIDSDYLRRQFDSTCNYRWPI